MLKQILKILKYIFENGPNFAFWVGVPIIFYGWYSKQHIVVQLLCVSLPLIGLVFWFKRALRDLNKQVLTATVKRNIGKSTELEGQDKVEALIKQIPSETNLRALYGYAREYAKNWAKDGYLNDLVYYIEVNNAEVRSRAQIFLHSKLRGEEKTTYFPAYSTGDNIKEIGESYFVKEAQPIYSFSGWRRLLSESIESMSSEISKADMTTIQITSNPSFEQLSFNFYFEKGNRQWKRERSHNLRSKKSSK